MNKYLSISILLVFGFIAPVLSANQDSNIVTSDTTFSTASFAPSADVVRRINQSGESQISPRIIGGTIADRGAYPEFTYVYAQKSTPDGVLSIKCGGTLINNTTVLTAAHCVADFSSGYIGVIPNLYSFNDGHTSEDFIDVSYVYIHPQYNPNTLNNDIALLTLIQPSYTPTATLFMGTDQLEGETATVIGVGLTSNAGTVPSTLNEVDLPIIGNDLCATVYGPSNITDSMLCAGFAAGGKDSCSGDSGGPLWVNYRGQRVQAGVVSFGTAQCALPYGYSGYARTSALIDFIMQYASVNTVTGNEIVMAPIIDLLLSEEAVAP